MATNFGENLIKLRKTMGLTRKELAEKLNVHENTLAGYELSGREPSYSKLIQIADFFGVTIDELIRPQLFRVMGNTTRLILIDGKDRKEVEFSEADKAGLRKIVSYLGFIQQLKEIGIEVEQKGTPIEIPLTLKITDNKINLNDVINKVIQHTDTDKVKEETDNV